MQWLSCQILDKRNANLRRRLPGRLDRLQRPQTIYARGQWCFLTCDASEEVPPLRQIALVPIVRQACNGLPCRVARRKKIDNACQAVPPQAASVTNRHAASTGVVPYEVKIQPGHQLMVRIIWPKAKHQVSAILDIDFQRALSCGGGFHPNELTKNPAQVVDFMA